MNLHEYQARTLLQAVGIPMFDGDVASTPTEAEAIARRIGGTVVIKAQVHAGGRGKAGGVKLARNPAEAADEEQMPHAARLEEAFERPGMLAREDFGRRHQGRLVAAGHADQEGVDGDDCLAAADIALEKAIHRRFAANIGRHVANRLSLGGGPLEGK